MDTLSRGEPAGKAGASGVRAVGPFAHATDLIVAALAVPEIRRSRLAHQVLCVLASHAASSGRCWRSKRTMAEQLETDPSAIRRAIRLLEAHGWVRREPRPGRATIYHLPIERHAALPPSPPSRSIETAENTPLSRTQGPFSSPREGGSLFGGASHPREGAPRPASGGARAPRTVRSEPEREPGHGYAGNLLEPKTDAELLEAVAAAAKSRDPAEVNRAAHGLSWALDRDFQWVGGYRRALYGSSPAEAVSRLERAIRHGHGSAFFREPPGPPPARSAPRARPPEPTPNHSEIPNSSGPSFREVWARFRR